MTAPFDQPQIVVVYADGNASSADPATLQRLQDRGLLRGQSTAPKSGFENVSGRNVRDFPQAAHDAILRRIDPKPSYCPHGVHRAFPARWQAYIRANFSDLRHVQQVFAVSERTARKWWNGETGANGGHVAIAVAENPVTAQRMLFAAE